jgi:hypothetical protein
VLSFAVAVIFGSAALAANLMLHTTKGVGLAMVLLTLAAIGGVVARTSHRI